MKKIAIIGWAPSYKKAPWNDESWEKWVINDMYRVCGDRFSRLYEVHSPDELVKVMGTEGVPADHTNVLKQFEGRVHTIHKARPDFPEATVIDLDNLIAQFGRYFTCTISYMIADAILESPDEIGIWGVDLAVGTEYSYERPGVEYLIGQAKGRGISIYLPPECDLLQASTLYGTEDTRYKGWIANVVERINHLNVKKNEIIAANVANNASLYAINGALEVLEYDQRVWSSGGAPRDPNAHGGDIELAPIIFPNDLPGHQDHMTGFSLPPVATETSDNIPDRHEHVQAI